VSVTSRASPLAPVKRTVICPYCQSSNYLPDSVWEKLNPVPKPQMFFLVFDAPTVAEEAPTAQAPPAHQGFWHKLFG